MKSVLGKYRMCVIDKPTAGCIYARHNFIGILSSKVKRIEAEYERRSETFRLCQMNIENI